MFIMASWHGMANNGGEHYNKAILDFWIVEVKRASLQEMQFILSKIPSQSSD